MRDRLPEASSMIVVALITLKIIPVRTVITGNSIGGFTNVPRSEKNYWNFLDPTPTRSREWQSIVVLSRAPINSTTEVALGSRKSGFLKINDWQSETFSLREVSGKYPTLDMSNLGVVPENNWEVILSDSRPYSNDSITASVK